MLLTGFLGLVGCGGFEILRLYKALWRHDPLPIDKRPLAYICVLICLLIFSAVATILFSPANAPSALFIGFSIPTGIKALLSPSDYHRELSAIHVDDIQIERTRFGIRRYFRRAFLSYFQGGLRP